MHIRFQEIGLVSCQKRVQLPESEICAKLVEEMVPYFNVTKSDYIIPLYWLLGDI